MLGVTWKGQAMKFRAGDVVSLQATVKHNFDEGDDDVSLSFSPGVIGGGTFWAKPELLTVIRQGIVLGDLVKFDVKSNRVGEEAILTGRVLAISDGHAWVDLGGGEYCTRMIDGIQRAED